MRVWRISDYADLSGHGGLLAEGRWHRRGTPVVYCADHPATALLERLVHLDPEELPDSYKLLAIEVGNSDHALRMTPGDLPDDWRDNLNASREIGTAFFTRGEHLLAFVPSVLVPQAWNVLLNPRHRNSRQCRIVETYDRLFDTRLIRRVSGPGQSG